MAESLGWIEARSDCASGSTCPCPSFVDPKEDWLLLLSQLLYACPVARARDRAATSVRPVLQRRNGIGRGDVVRTAGFLRISVLHGAASSCGAVQGASAAP